jgi:hypothetical protein
VNLKPGDLVRVREDKMGYGVEVYIFELTNPDAVFIVKQVVLNVDPLGPTGHLEVLMVDPTTGQEWKVDGNWLEKL